MATAPTWDEEKRAGEPEKKSDHHSQDGGDDSGSDKVQAPENDFVVVFSGEDDPFNPHSMSYARKWAATIVIALCSVCATVNSTLYTFTYDQLEPLFHVSRLVCTLGLTTFVIGLALGPMFLAPLSEFYGRRPIYLGSFLMVLIWLVPCAAAQNIQTILVGRFFDGLFCSVFLSVAGGTIGDMFVKSELSAPMMIYSGSPFLGPSIGPVIGGFINYYADWRWSFYTLLIWTFVQLIAIFILIPETYHPVRLKAKAKQMRKETGDERWRAPMEMTNKSISRTILLSCYRPFQMLLLEPMCANLCLISAILLGILYLFFGAFPVVFETNHDFTLWQVGLAFCGLLTGMALSVATDPLWQRHYQGLVAANNGVSEPEFRLPPTVVGVWFCVAGLFAFGWTTFASVHWIVPIVLSGLFGFGVIICYKGIFTFLVESYPLYAASSLAANSFARSMFAASFPLFGVQMYERLDYQWATSVLGFLMLAVAPFPWIFYKYGKRIRGTSRFASA